MIVIKINPEEQMRLKQFQARDNLLFTNVINWQLFSTPKQWNPLTDIIDTENAIVVRLEAAGMCEDDFDIWASASHLTIRGFRRESLPVFSYYQMEIPFGEFNLTIALPQELDIQHATASYKNGFLVISLPKME